MSGTRKAPASDKAGRKAKSAEPESSDDTVKRASEQSFPASDPPAWTGTAGAGDPEPKGEKKDQTAPDAAGPG